MARCKLTRMSLRNIRKDKQYQCIVIDFVRTGVISKSKAEELLNYTIPAGLLEGSVAAPDDDEDEPGTGGEGTGGEGTGGEGTGGETTGSVTLAVNLDDMGNVLGASSAITPKGGNRGVEATSGSQGGAESDGWLLVNFPLPEDPEDRWLVYTDRITTYNTELLTAMYDAIQDAVVATGDFTAEDFKAYLVTADDDSPDMPWLVTTNEDYQIGEDAWNSRFTASEESPLELTDGMIFSYTEPNAGGVVPVNR